MSKLVVFNHKMSLLYEDLYNYIERVNNIETDNDIIICPSNIYLEAFVNNSVWPIGSQNMHYDTNYRHTGEVSTNQLKSLGIMYSLIGHYERVRDFNENKIVVNEKLIAALDANIMPILCFGEDIDDDYKEVLPKLIDAYLKDIVNIDFIVFAYEPVYAISSGTTPSADRIKEVTSFISKYLEDKYKKKPTLIYGGGVNSSNIHDIMDIDTLSGVIIGDISSDVNEAVKIINNLE